LPFLLVPHKNLEKVYARRERVNSLSYRADAEERREDELAANQPEQQAFLSVRMSSTR
jgi:hypothetical protein